MKLATYQDGSREGQLVVVSRDLTSAHYATGIANRLQAVLDDWNFLSPQLQDLSDDLNAGRTRHAFAFEPERCMAPLPRPFAYLEGDAYVHRDELLQQAAGTSVAARKTPSLTRLGGSAMLGPVDAVRLQRTGVSADFESGLAVVTGDIPAGCTPERGLEGIRLLMLAGGIALRGPAPAEFDARPATSFGPVAVTTDELGAAWSRGRLAGVLQTTWNGRKVGLCEADADMAFHFGDLIARAARHGRLVAGTIVGSGPASHRGTPREAGAEGKRVRRQDASGLEWPRGYGSIVEKRAIETLQDGSAKTAWLQAHDTVRIEMKGRDGQSIFGAIAQEVTFDDDGGAAAEA
ncbi:fumarylacetoacetate hydrolase family protein [Xylophilus sp. GOD-11R]|uniref:fumarylacetoacetate hydrolase family protein n=1 Tax=Xylophilus sp. GOD-11R TaxID=3089814 RepID=UPI00298BEA3E|nr:fumarylacetoacetate hydrolase family protein [Xylophilus sp. GOD-11R]WPB56731.1 fumarylacetoacetate hydrolase family protein [Xylophilus sp. GOD-11R]